MSARASSEAAPEIQRGAALLHAATRALWAARSVRAVAQIATRSARELLSADGASLLELAGDSSTCVYEEALEPLFAGRRSALDDCTRLVLQQRQQLAIDDVATDARAHAYRLGSVKSLWGTPLGEEPAALVLHSRALRHVTDVEWALLIELAESTALALASARVFEQLTQRAERRTQELIAANRELETFTYSVAHDLRSPLTCVVGFADLLERKYAAGLDEKGRLLLQEIVSSGQNMSALIDGLLGLAQQGRGTLAREQVDLSALAERVLGELSRAQNRAPELSIEPNLVVSADATLLEVVLSQLLGNALKYTAKQPQARIELARASEQPHAFVVRDNGVGFDPARANRLFAPFQRLHSQEEFPGVGVGLATVARIVRKHGGNVWADGQEGKGASFTFSLPPEAPEG